MGVSTRSMATFSPPQGGTTPETPTSPHGRRPAWLLLGNRPAGGRDLPGPGQEPRSPQAEQEPADVGEEGDPAAVGRGAEQPEVGLDELVQEPQPQEDPGGDGD